VSAERDRVRSARTCASSRSSSWPRQGDDTAPARARCASRVTDAVGLSAEIVLVRAGSLPKPSSGKLQRALCKTRYFDDILEPVAP
jgi:hypothetical protein